MSIGNFPPNTASTLPCIQRPAKIGGSLLRPRSPDKGQSPRRLRRGLCNDKTEISIEVGNPAIFFFHEALPEELLYDELHVVGGNLVLEQGGKEQVYDVAFGYSGGGKAILQKE